MLINPTTKMFHVIQPINIAPAVEIPHMKRYIEFAPSLMRKSALTGRVTNLARSSHKPWDVSSMMINSPTTTPRSYNYLRQRKLVIIITP